MRLFLRGTALAAGAALVLWGGPARASSHSDAPLIKLDPQANLTDVYAFVSRNGAGVTVLTTFVHVRPFSEPGDGAMYDAFSADALYSIHLTHPVNGATVRRFDFRFSPLGVSGSYKNLGTILRYGRGADVGASPDVGAINDVGDAHHNFVQSYMVTVTPGVSPRRPLVLGPFMTPPPNVGQRVTPHYNGPDGRATSGATNPTALDRYTRQTVYTTDTGLTLFAGPREDGFYADLPGIFDLLNPRILGGPGQQGGGHDGFKGFNVLGFGLQIPVEQLSGLPGSPTVAVYASVSRQRVTLRSASRPESTGRGPWIQVNRMGNPLFNEALVGLRDKDNYNAGSPAGDTAFATYATNPELATLINATFGTSVATTGRTDLSTVYIPDVLRVDTSTDPVRLAGQPGFSRLSLFGEDLTGGRPGGWPNGRRFGDDVVDIALTVLASGPSYTTITLLGDNVPANDQVYHQVFPYSATPHAGPRHSKDSGPNDL